MKKIKGVLKKSVEIAKELIDGFHYPENFYPNNVMDDLSANRQSGIVAVNTFPVLCQNNHMTNISTHCYYSARGRRA